MLCGVGWRVRCCRPYRDGVVDGWVRLGVDFGTSNTVAVLGLGQRPPRPLLFDGSPLLPSAVCVDPTGRLLVGQDALHAGLMDPASFEPHPKRRIDEDTLLLGGVEVPVEAAIAAVLRRVAEEAGRVAGGPVPHVVVTCPAGWASPRRGRLLAAAQVAFPSAELVAEPVAASRFFADLVGARIPEGRHAVVYDLGAGTFDVSVLRRSGDEFEVLVTHGLSDTGGLDIDAAIVGFLAATFADRDRAAWNRLAQPVTEADRRASRLLWDGVRSGKETLSRITTTMLHVPLFDTQVPFGREQLDTLARPVLDRSVEATRNALQEAAVGDGQLAGLFLVGGSSRMPLVATVLHQAFGIVPIVIDQPELAVAEGSARTTAPPLPGPTPVAPPPAPIDETAVPAPPRRRHRWPIAVAAMLAALLIVLLAFQATTGNKHESSGHGGAAALASAGASPSTHPSPSPSPSTLVDPCLVGTWKTTSVQVINTVNTQPVRFSSPGGRISRQWPDGTSIEELDGDAPLTATFNGVHLEEVVHGTTRSHTTTRDGVEYTSAISGEPTFTLKRDGTVYQTGPLVIDPEPEQYTCSETTLRIFSTKSSTESVRISHDPGPLPG
jgi:hypothetical protein